MTNIYSYVLTCECSKERLINFQLKWNVAKNADVVQNQTPEEAFPLTVVWGMNSKRFPRSPWWRVGSVRAELQDRQTGNGLDRRGHTACYWGHVQTWRQALAEHDADFERGVAAFFEDDCLMDSDFWIKARQAMKELPEDWNVLYFGGEHRIHGRPAPTVYSENLYKVENVNRLHAYAIPLRTLPKIILWFEENWDWGHNFRDPKTGQSEAEVDFALASLVESGELQGFAMKPWICSQGAGFSFTQGVNEKERRWNI